MVELNDFEAAMKQLIEESANAPRAMTLHIDEESSSVELLLDNKTGSYYGEWIKGEGGDICLYRDQETLRVVGCFLPLYCTNLVVTRSKKDNDDDDAEILSGTGVVPS